MDFIVNNWLIFGGLAVFFIIALFANFAMMASKMRIRGIGIFLHFFLGLMVFLAGVPFVIGAIVQIIRYANKG